MNMEQQVGDVKIRILRDTCIGSGNCVKVAPDVFHLDDEALVAFNDDVADADRDQAVEACQVCPVQALIATDAQGEQLAP